jgi:hypothetical protein
VRSDILGVIVDGPSQAFIMATVLSIYGETIQSLGIVPRLLIAKASCLL